MFECKNSKCAAYGGNLCKSHGGGFQNKELTQRHISSKLTREELEDRFYKSCEKNTELKRLINNQDEKIKILGTKLLRLTNQQKKEKADVIGSTQYRSVESILEEQSHRIQLLEAENRFLQDKIQYLKIQLTTRNNLLLSPRPQKVSGMIKVNGSKDSSNSKILQNDSELYMQFDKTHQICVSPSPQEQNMTSSQSEKKSSITKTTAELENEIKEQHKVHKSLLNEYQKIVKILKKYEEKIQNNPSAMESIKHHRNIDIQTDDNNYKRYTQINESLSQQLAEEQLNGMDLRRQLNAARIAKEAFDEVKEELTKINAKIYENTKQDDEKNKKTILCKDLDGSENNLSEQKSSLSSNMNKDLRGSENNLNLRKSSLSSNMNKDSEGSENNFKVQKSASIVSLPGSKINVQEENESIPDQPDLQQNDKVNRSSVEVSLPSIQLEDVQKGNISTKVLRDLDQNLESDSNERTSELTIKIISSETSTDKNQLQSQTQLNNKAPENISQTKFNVITQESTPKIILKQTSENERNLIMNDTFSIHISCVKLSDEVLSNLNESICFLTCQFDHHLLACAPLNGELFSHFNITSSYDITMTRDLFAVFKKEKIDFEIHKIGFQGNELIAFCSIDMEIMLNSPNERVHFTIPFKLLKPNSSVESDEKYDTDPLGTVECWIQLNYDPTIKNVDFIDDTVSGINEKEIDQSGNCLSYNDDKAKANLLDLVKEKMEKLEPQNSETLKGIVENDNQILSHSLSEKQSAISKNSSSVIMNDTSEDSILEGNWSIPIKENYFERSLLPANKNIKLQLDSVHLEDKIVITIRWIKFTKNSIVYDGKNITQLFVAYSFLGHIGNNMETSSLPIPNAPGEKSRYNFRRAFTIQTLKNQQNKMHLLDMLSSKATKPEHTIVFTVISEPKEDILDTQDCEDIGEASVDIIEVLAAHPDGDKCILEEDIYSFYDQNKKIGTLCLKIEGLNVMRKCQKEAQT